MTRPNFVRCSAFALLALLGCSSESITAPKSIAGYVFRAESLDSSPLPVVFADEAGITYTLYEDRLAFDNVGGLTRASTILATTKATGAKSYTTSSQSLRAVITGAHITLTPLTPCPPNASCVGNDEGSIIGKTIRLKSYLYSQPGLVQFQRAERTVCSNCNYPDA